MKVKDTDMLILMVYAFAFNSSPYDWYLQINSGNVVGVKEIYQKF